MSLESDRRRGARTTLYEDGRRVAVLASPDLETALELAVQWAARSIKDGLPPADELRGEVVAGDERWTVRVARSDESDPIDVDRSMRSR